jgi:hypothetical protein
VKLDAPRPLTSGERAVLGFLLDEDFEGVDQLRVQAASAVVVGRCDCGCPTIDLGLDADAPASNLSGRLAPTEAIVQIDGRAPGEVILFLDDWKLDSMEYVWYDLRPENWPDVAHLTRR